MGKPIWSKWKKLAVRQPPSLRRPHQLRQRQRRHRHRPHQLRQHLQPGCADWEGEVVTAPMPGTVTKILVKDGDAVTENQPLMILEAMKMENEIVAPKAGTIGQVFATLNQNVNSGDNLISII